MKQRLTSDEERAALELIFDQASALYLQATTTRLVGIAASIRDSAHTGLDHIETRKETQ